MSKMLKCKDLVKQQSPLRCLLTGAWEGFTIYPMRGYKEWRSEARCKTERELFDKKPKEAKQFCKGCPVKSDCFEYAMVHDERGIWGGTSYSDRLRMTRRSPEFRAQLIREAVHLGLYETRYSIAQYIESLHAARRLHTRTQVEKPIDLVQVVEELSELVAELDSLLVS